MHVEAFNGYPINRPLSSSVVLTCDASESGYGAHISFGGERRFCSGMWSFVERAKSSSFRELLAVDLVMAYGIPRNETKRNETKRNETKRNEMK